MRHFALFIDNEVRGPLSEYEVQDLINAGTVHADTQCAPAGSTEWEPLGNHFTFGSSIKLTKKVEKSEAEAEVDASRLDVDVRRKLLMYGLADSATVDQISQAQAEIVLGGHESDLRAKISVHRTVGLSAFFVALALAGFVGAATDLGGALLGKAAAKFAKDDPKATDNQKRFDSDVKRFEELQAQVQLANFQRPTGGQLLRPVLLNRLRIPENQGFKVSGAVDTSPLANLLTKWNIKLDEGIKVYALGTAMPTDIQQKVAEQATVLDTVLSPMLDDASFEKFRAEAVASFPVDAAPESARLKSEMEQMKLAELKTAIDRVEFRAREADKVGNSKWAGELRTFSSKLRDLQNRIRINVDPNARKKVWSEFNSGLGAELGAWVLASNAKEIKVDQNGNFQIPETGKLEAEAAPTRLLVTAQINGDTVYLAWGSKFLACRDLRSEEIPKDVFLTREQYKVLDKPVTGNRRHYVRYRVGDKEITANRFSPKWYFFVVARDKDTDPLIVMVDAETHGKFPVGGVVPTELLEKCESFPRLTESPAPAPLLAAE
jgi:hypothetical protein